MNETLIAAGRIVLGSLALVGSPGKAHAAPEDSLSTRLLAAWERFSELQDFASSYGSGGEIALKQMQAERQQADLRATVRAMQVEVDSWHQPLNRSNRFQEQHYQELQLCRRQSVEVDRYLVELRLQWQQENEAAIRQAEAQGKQVKRLDRVGLLVELQKKQRDSQDAFAQAKAAIADAAGRPGKSRTQVYQQALAQVARPDQLPSRAVPQKQFRAAFEDFCGGKRFFGATSNNKGFNKLRVLR
jgi:hypothetical protein